MKDREGRIFTLNEMEQHRAKKALESGIRTTINGKSFYVTGQSTDRGGFLFDDPYWDDVFCSYYDPTLRTCCRG